MAKLNVEVTMNDVFAQIATDRQELCDLRQRVTGLLAANNRLVEEKREALVESRMLRDQLETTQAELGRCQVEINLTRRVMVDLGQREELVRFSQPDPIDLRGVFVGDFVSGVAQAQPGSVGFDLWN